MTQRGRKSAAALSVARVVHVEPRPVAPSDLTDEQAREWDAVVSRMAADHFSRERWALLAQYCRHVVAARRVAQLIARCEEADSLDVGEYDQLLKMQEREGRALSSLATRLRLTPAAVQDRRKSAAGSTVEPPWQT
jgi:hypothetical protein